MRALAVCTTCRYSPEDKTGPDGRTGGEMLLAEIRAAQARGHHPGIAVTGQPCLWSCKRFCNVAFRDDARFSYLAGDFRPTAAAAEAILDWFALHGESERGEVPFRSWPDEMRGHFIGRMPPVQP